MLVHDFEYRKEASIKNIYELNSVVRMSLIEMQFIKKVRWRKHVVWHILDIAKIIKGTTGIPSCF